MFILQKYGIFVANCDHIFQVAQYMAVKGQNSLRIVAAFAKTGRFPKKHCDFGPFLMTRNYLCFVGRAATLKI
jgi:hypothetical protein